jgi:hypothetical protein
MTFDDFLNESGEYSEQLAARSRKLATTAKSTESEMQHDRASRRHQEAAAKQRRQNSEQSNHA